MLQSQSPAATEEDVQVLAKRRRLSSSEAESLLILMKDDKGQEANFSPLCVLCTKCLSRDPEECNDHVDSGSSFVNNFVSALMGSCWSSSTFTRRASQHLTICPRCHLVVTCVMEKKRKAEEMELNIKQLEDQVQLEKRRLKNELQEYDEGVKMLQEIICGAGANEDSVKSFVNEKELNLEMMFEVRKAILASGTNKLKGFLEDLMIKTGGDGNATAYRIKAAAEVQKGPVSKNSMEHVDSDLAGREYILIDDEMNDIEDGITESQNNMSPQTICLPQQSTNEPFYQRTAISSKPSSSGRKICEISNDEQRSTLDCDSAEADNNGSTKIENKDSAEEETLTIIVVESTINTAVFMRPTIIYNRLSNQGNAGCENEPDFNGKLKKINPQRERLIFFPTGNETSILADDALTYRQIDISVPTARRVQQLKNEPSPHRNEQIGVPAVSPSTLKLLQPLKGTGAKEEEELMLESVEAGLVDRLEEAASGRIRPSHFIETEVPKDKIGDGTDGTNSKQTNEKGTLTVNITEGQNYNNETDSEADSYYGIREQFEDDDLEADNSEKHFF